VSKINFLLLLVGYQRGESSHKCYSHVLLLIAGFDINNYSPGSLIYKKAVNLNIYLQVVLFSLFPCMQSILRDCKM